MNNQMKNGQNQVNISNTKKIVYIITLIVIAVIAVALIKGMGNNNKVSTSKITAEERKAFTDNEEDEEEQVIAVRYCKYKINEEDILDVNGNPIAHGEIVPGEELAPTDYISGNIGEEYTTTRKNIEGYKPYGVDPINKIGNFQETSTARDIVYYYQLDTDTVEVDNVNSVVTVTVFKGEALNGIENTLTIQTKDYDNGENLLGSEYKITDEDGNLLFNTSHELNLVQIVNEIVAGSFTAIPTKKTYTIEQTKFPTGYRPLDNNKVSFSIQKVKNDGADEYHVEFESTSNPRVTMNYDAENNKIEAVFINRKAPEEITVKVETETRDKDTNALIPNAIFKATEGENILFNDYAPEGKVEVTNYTITDDSDLGVKNYRIEQVTAPDEYVPLANNVVNIAITTAYDDNLNAYVSTVTSDASSDIDVTLENNTILVTFKNKHVIYKKNMKIVVITEDFYDSSKKLDATYTAMSRSENQPEEQGEDITPIGDDDHDKRYEITDIEIGDEAIDRYTIKQQTVEDKYILNDIRATIVLNKRIDTAHNKYEASLADGSSEDIEIVGNEIIVTIKNKKIPEERTIPVFIEAKDKDTNEPIPGGKYNLEEPEGRIIESKEITTTDNQLGSITIKNTDTQNLIIKQIENPENYIKITENIPVVINTKLDATTNTYVSTVQTSTVENVTYDLREDGLHVIILNKHVPYTSDVKVYVRTKDNKGNLIQGATYKMTMKTDGEDQEINQITTNEDRQLLQTITIDNADNKVYYVKEVAAPSQYVKSKDKVVLNLDNYLDDSTNTYKTEVKYGEYNSVEIERNQNEITLTFGNALSIQKTNLDVVVKTVDKDGNSILGGKYKLLTAARDVIREATEETAGLKLTTFEINGEGENNYYLVEENAPEGYFKFEGDIPFKIKNKVNLETQKYEPVLEKQYQENIIAKIENGVLTITVINNKKPDIQNLKVYIITQDLSENPILGSTYQVLDSGKNEILKELANEEKLQILDLQIAEEGTNTYYINQIVAPEGYITNEEEIRVDLIKSLDTENNKYITSVNESTYENVEFVLNGDELDIIFRNEVVPPPLPVFDLQVQKKLTQVRVIRKGIITTLNKKSDSEIMKVDIPAAQVDETELEIDFNIIIKNVGEVDGWVTQLADLHPEDFDLIDEKGKWVDADLSAVTDKYANKGIAPGGTLTIPVTMKWKLKSDNIGARVNKAKILEYRNEYDLIDPTPDNEGEDGLLVTIKTGGFTTWAIQIFGLIVLAFVAVIIIKKLLNSESEQ